MEESHNPPACHMVSNVAADEPHAEVHLRRMSHAAYLLKLQKMPLFEKALKSSLISILPQLIQHETPGKVT